MPALDPDKQLRPGGRAACTEKSVSSRDAAPAEFSRILEKTTRETVRKCGGQLFYCSRFYRAPVCLDLFMPVAPITGTLASFTFFVERSVAPIFAALLLHCHNYSFLWRATRA